MKIYLHVAIFHWLAGDMDQEYVGYDLDFDLPSVIQQNRTDVTKDTDYDTIVVW